MRRLRSLFVLLFAVLFGCVLRRIFVLGLLRTVLLISFGLLGRFLLLGFQNLGFCFFGGLFLFCNRLSFRFVSRLDGVFIGWAEQFLKSFAERGAANVCLNHIAVLADQHGKRNAGHAVL